MLPGLASAQDSLGVVRESILSPAWSLTAQPVFAGDTLYLATWQSGLRVLDLSDPYHPEEIGWSLDVDPNSAAAAGDDRLVVSSEDRLVVMDVSIPSSPTVLGDAWFPGHPVGLATDGTTVWSAEFDTFIRAYDISDPTEILQVASTMADEAVIFGRTGDILLVGQHHDGLTLCDVSNPAVIDATAHLYAGQEIWSVAARGDMLYIPVGGQVRIVTIDAPDDPVEVGTIDVGGTVAVQGTRLGVCDEDSLRLFDITDPALPVPMGSVHAYLNGGFLGLGDDVAVTCTGGQNLSVFDLSDPAAPVEAACIQRGHTLHEIVLRGEHVYTASGDGFAVYDITDPTAAAVLAELPLSGTLSALHVWGHIAYVVGYNRLYSVDISNPASPQMLHGRGLVFPVRDTGAWGDVFVQAGNEELRFLDTSDPEQIVNAGVFDTSPGIPHEVVVHGRWVYAQLQVNSNYQLLVLDALDPYTPQLVELVDIEPNDALSMVVEDGRLYLSSGQGLHVFDLSDPTCPEFIGTVPLDGLALQFTVQGTQATWVTAYTEPLRIFDISDPLNPVELGFYDDELPWSWTAAEGNRIVRAGLFTLSVLDAHEATSTAHLELDVSVPQPLQLQRGERIPLDITLAARDGGETVDAWTRVTGWNGVSIAPVWHSEDLTVLPGMPIDSSLVSRAVPWNAPPGPASFEILVGDYPSTYAARATVDFHVVAPAADLAVDDQQAADASADPRLPTEFGLNPVSPNPFNAVTTVDLLLPDPATVRVEVVSVTGRRVATLHEGPLPAGRHALAVDGSRWASGIYLLRATGDSGETAMRKLALVK